MNIITSCVGYYVTSKVEFLAMTRIDHIIVTSVSDVKSVVIDDSFLGYCAMWSRLSKPTFYKCVLLPSSGRSVVIGSLGSQKAMFLTLSSGLFLQRQGSADYKAK
jgi:hypothetical protein